MPALQLIISECPPFEKKNQGCGDVEYGDVDPVGGFSKHPIISVKQHRDQDEPQ